MREQAIKACLQEIVKGNDDDSIIAGFDILNKLINNILKNPTEEKFRVLKKTNKTIQAKVMALQPPNKVEELLSNLGYINMDDEVMAFAGDYFVVLARGSQLIDEENQKLKNLKMTPEERAKFEKIQEERKAYL